MLATRMSCSWSRKSPAIGTRTRHCGQSSIWVALFLAAMSIAAGVGYFYYLKTTAMVAARQAAAARGQAGAQAAASIGAARPAAGRMVSTTPDRAEVRTPLVLIAAVKEGKSGPVVALGRPEGSRNEPDFRGTRQGLLERELVRQAMLIAARDELGLSTRDELLDDAPPARGEGPPLELATLFRPDECHLLVRRGEGEKAEVLLAVDLGTKPDAAAFMPELVAKMEAASRAGFPSLLKQLGLEGAPNQVREEAPVPKDVEDRLDRLGFVDQIAAIRALHQAIRADGESASRLSALARAYAQLGALTEYQWSPSHRAFKARALLYAYRMLERHPGSPLALRTQAFVLAMAGRHDLALTALERAKAGEATVKEAGPPPSWVPLIEAYLKADSSRLAVKDGPNAHLAALLAMISLEYPHGTRVLLRAASDLVERDPDCCRGHDVIASNGKLGERHFATQSGPLAFDALFPERLKSLATTPASVKGLLDRGAEELPLLDALDQAGLPGADAGEPSWGVLAHLARDARFMHVLRRVSFMTQKWNVPAGEYLNEVRPMVARHRFYPYLQYLASPGEEGHAALAGLADNLDLAEIELNEQPMIHALRERKLAIGNAAVVMAVSHASILSRDFAEHIVHVPDRRAHFGRLLLNVSPYSAFAMSTLIGVSWKQVKDEVPAWREKVGDAPALIRALANKHMQLKQYDQAEDYLRRSIELSPDPRAYRSLADCHRSRGDLEGWRSTLDRFLADTEPAGLEHAQVQVEIANDLMRRKKWAEAKPYAEAAAETWAAWAMLCASYCNEGLGDWGRAELWIRRISERYTPRNWSSWYLFCARTGHGDINAARRFALNYLAPVDQRSEVADPQDIGYFYWTAGSPKNALAFLEKAEAAQSSPLNAFCAILLADEVGDAARRDRKFKEFVDRFERSTPRMVTIARLMTAAMADGGRRPLDATAVEREIAGMSANARANAEFLVGRFLLNHHHPEEAGKHLKYAADSPETYTWLKILAADSLRTIDAKGSK